MTIKEAVLKSLEDIGKVTNYMAVYEHIIKSGYYNFGNAKTPASTVSAFLGDFIRNGDSRVKRIKEAGGTYSYYLTKYENSIPNESLIQQLEVNNKLIGKKKTYIERDLHKLLTSYLKNLGIYSKTIFHEQSTFGKDNNQTWSHPDIVGVSFLNFKSKASQSFLKVIKQVDVINLRSYEVKKEINNDSELKKSFFQAVSNSSWANYGYLVAYEFSSNLFEEMERLNQSFGIGIIELSSNPFQSKVLFQPKYHELDFKTIDKLCSINKEFENFVEQTEKLLIAEEKYYKSTEKEFDEFCDDYFLNESDARNYCLLKQIPVDK